VVFRVSGMALDGSDTTTYTQLEIPAGDSATERLSAAGLEVSVSGDMLAVDFVNFGSAAEEAGIDFGWNIEAVQAKLDRPPKEVMFIPALLLLALVAFGQLKRKAREDAQPQAA